MKVLEGGGLARAGRSLSLRQHVGAWLPVRLVIEGHGRPAREKGPLVGEVGIL